MFDYLTMNILKLNCLNWKMNCDDHSSLSSTTAVHIWTISYKLHMNILVKRSHFRSIPSKRTKSRSNSIGFFALILDYKRANILIYFCSQLFIIMFVEQTGFFYFVKCNPLGVFYQWIKLCLCPYHPMKQNLCFSSCASCWINYKIWVACTFGIGFSKYTVSPLLYDNS